MATGPDKGLTAQKRFTILILYRTSSRDDCKPLTSEPQASAGSTRKLALRQIASSRLVSPRVDSKVPKHIPETPV